jgi:Lon-like protease
VSFLRALFLPASLAILVMAALTVPLPVFYEQPGTPLSLRDTVSVEGGDVGDVDGDFLLTAVSLRPGTVARLLHAAVDRDAQIVSRSLVVPVDEPEDEYFDRQRDVFRSSAQVAAAVALAAAGFDVDPTELNGSGVLVRRVLPDSPAMGSLEPGDVIIAVDGRSVGIVDDLRDAVGGDAGPREIAYVRDDDHATATITPAELATPAGTVLGIGVEITTLDPRIDLPVDVEVDSGRIGGPSAGLMMALTVFDKVSGEDLAAGRTIAGTGTLSAEGRVGSIGGIPRKVTSAERIGADVFVAPAGQLEEAMAARRSGDGLQIVGAATFDEALAALRGAVDRAGRALPVIS